MSQLASGGTADLANPLDPGRGVFSQNDLRRILDSLEAARPDISEALDLVRIAVGLRTLRGAAAACLIDAEWKVTR